MGEVMGEVRCDVSTQEVVTATFCNSVTFRYEIKNDRSYSASGKEANINAPIGCLSSIGDVIDSMERAAERFLS